MRKSCQAISNLFYRSQYNYTPVSNYRASEKINPIIAVTFENSANKKIDLEFRLFENVVPRTSENFKRLLLGNGLYKGRKLTLIGNHIHNFIPRAYAQLGHLEGGNCSIYGPKFRDESFQLYHDRPGLLSCVSEQNTNNSRFLITTAPCPFLNMKNIVFGEVTAESFNALRIFEKEGKNLTDYKIVTTSEVIKEDHHGHAHGHSHGHH